MADDTLAQRLGTTWVFPDGTRLPVISGGADDDPPDPKDPPDPDPKDPPDPDDDLGEKGKKALNEERSARRKAEKAAKDAQAELDKIREANQSEQEKAVAAAKAEGKTEALQTANQRLVRAEVKAAAAGRLADPDDAARMIDLDQFEVDDDGEVDTKAIKSAIDDLVKEKPYLSADGAKPGPLPGGGKPTTEGGNSMNDFIRQAAGRT